MVYIKGRFMFFKVLPCSLSSCFVIPLRNVITSLWEERAGRCASRALVCLLCTRLFLSFFFSSWCRGLAAICDCGTPWTFLLTFFYSTHTQLTLLSQRNRKIIRNQTNQRPLKHYCLLHLYLTGHFLLRVFIDFSRFRIWYQKLTNLSGYANRTCL